MPNTVNGSLALPPEMLAVVERYAVYRCYSDGGELLYVGVTGAVGRRLGDHIQKAWFTQVRGMTFEWYPTELDALNAERRAIHVEHPRYNIVHRNAPTLRQPAPARRKRRKPRTPVTSPEEARVEAMRILAETPDISGAKLGELCGKSERWGQLRKSELASHVADGGTPQD